MNKQRRTNILLTWSVVDVVFGLQQQFQATFCDFYKIHPFPTKGVTMTEGFLSLLSQPAASSSRFLIRQGNGGIYLKA